MPTLYLAGPINGCTDAEALDWRHRATAALAPSFTIRSPMARDYRGDEYRQMNAIVDGDKADIDASDVMLVNAERPSWGTAMEVHYAHSRDKHVVAVVPSGPVSPWLRYHTGLVCVGWSEAYAHCRAWAHATAPSAMCGVCGHPRRSGHAYLPSHGVEACLSSGIGGLTSFQPRGCGGGSDG